MNEKLNPLKVIRANMKSSDKTDKNVKQLKDSIVWLMMETEYTSLDTKTFLKGTPRGNVGMVNDMLVAEGKVKKDNAIYQALHRDIKKFNKDFGERCAVDLFMYEDTKKIEEYTKRVLTVLGKYRNAGLVSGIGLDLDKGSGKIEMSIETREFDRLVKLIEPYTSKSIKKVIHEITTEQIGYLNYLNRFDGLTETDEARKKLLLEMIT